jgi:WD40 repeat protein
MVKKLSLLAAFVVITSLVYSKKSVYTSFETDSKIIFGICFTYKGGALGIADNNEIKVYSTEDKKLLNEFKNGHKKQILTIDISNDSTILVSGGRDSTIIIWDFITGKVIKSLSFQKGIVTSVDISSDGRYLISGGTDRKVYLYDIEKDELVNTFPNHSDDICSVKISPDGTMIASASGDGMINLFNIETLEHIASLQGHTNWVRDISFSKDCATLFSCGDDSKIIKWNISNRSRITIKNTTREGFGWLLSVDVHEDSQTFVSGGFDGKVRIATSFGGYSTRVRKPINKVIFKPHEGAYLKVAIATRGKGVVMIDARNM